MFEVLTAGKDVVSDVQDIVGFVIGQMPFEKVEIPIDIADQAGPSSQQENGTDTAGTETLDAIGLFVVDIGGGHHGLFASGPGRFSMRRRIRRWRPLKILRLRSRGFISFFSDFLGIV